MNMSQQINELAAALAKAQSAFPQIDKNKSVDYTFNGKRTNYSYADLSHVIECVTKELSANGLCISQVITTNGDRQCIETILMHSSGQYISGCYPIAQRQKAQEIGSEITYARRYSYCSIIGIHPEDDDDGAAASQDFSNYKETVLEKPAKTSFKNFNKTTSTNSTNKGDIQ